MSQHIFFPNSCPNCGNQLLYGSGKKELRCKSCGHKRALQRNSDQVAERGLTQGIKFSQFQLGMGDHVRVLACGSCKTTLGVQEGKQQGRCPMCGSEDLKPADLPAGVYEPKDILPFTVPAVRAAKILNRYLKKRRPWMLPRAIFKITKPERLHPVYVPAYLIDSYVRASWKAMAGFRVPVANKAKIEEKEVWEPVTGYWENLFEDHLTLVSGKINGGVFAKINDFPLRDLVNYDPGYLQAFPVEISTKDPMNAVKAAEKNIDESVKGQAEKQIRGEKFKDLKVLGEKEAITFRHILLPVWVSSFSYKGNTYQYLVNGRTGKVAGAKPISILRILILAGLILAALALIVWARL